MAATHHSPLHGDELTTAVTASVVALHERYYHRTPAHASTQLMQDEMLAVVLSGVYTDVEKTLIEMQRVPLVRDARSSFQHALGPRMVAVVERLSGRRVETFSSSNHIGPDLDVTLFELAAPDEPASDTQ